MRLDRVTLLSGSPVRVALRDAKARGARPRSRPAEPRAADSQARRRATVLRPHDQDRPLATP